MTIMTSINNKDKDLKENIPLLFSGVCGLMFLIIEAKLFINFINSEESALSVLLSVHVLSLFLMLTGCIVFYWRGFDIKVPVMHLIYAAILGPIGIFSMTAATIIYILSRRNSSDFLAWLSALFPEYSGSKSEDIYEQIIYGEEHEKDEISVEPFADIMEYGTIEQRQLAVVRISQHFTPRFSPILLNALHDEENTVRVQAASAIAVIEDNFSRRYQEMAAEVKNAEVDTQTLFKFAFLCNEYANSGLVTEERSNTLRNGIINTAEKYLEKDTKNLSVKSLLAQNYYLTMRYERTEQVLEDYFKTEIDHKNSKLYLEALLKQRKFDKIRSFCKKNYSTLKTQQPTGTVNCLEAMKLWTLYTQK